jgi:hypothetical protein
MEHYYLPIDVSKGYADFVILNDKKEPIESWPHSLVLIRFAGFSKNS